ncbi:MULTISPECIES: biotin/lipoyl-binding protein [unclassified Aureimonas]|uniref:biotin/lipoyl-binding protein n=1 Tax=unclassified Aureimonas TaxID=2615206 RepID=UPI000A53AA55|nr:MULTISPECIES: biotin/lipoyl-binding protein [unclassified Aureimonas]
MTMPSFLQAFMRRDRSAGAGTADEANASAAPVQPTDCAPAEGVATGTSDIIGGASQAILLCFGLFVLWGFAFPLSSAVIAQGSLVSSGFNQLVQHLTGGTVVEILAHDGDRVEAGATIARLDPAVARAELTRLKSRRATLAAIEERLRTTRSAQISDKDALRASIVLVDGAVSSKAGGSGSETAQLDLSLDEKLRLEQMRARLEGLVSLEAGLEALRRQASAAEAKFDGLERSIGTLEHQIAIYDDQAESLRRLSDADHISRRDLWASEDQLLSARSRLFGLVAERDIATDRLGELEANSQELLGTTARDEAVQLTQIIGELAEIEDQIAAAERALTQSALRAPVGGTLVNSTLLTKGCATPSSPAWRSPSS